MNVWALRIMVVVKQNDLVRLWVHQHEPILDTQWIRFRLRNSPDLSIDQKTAPQRPFPGED